MVDLSWIHMTPSAELKSIMFVNFNKTLMVDQHLVIILLLHYMESHNLYIKILLLCSFSISKLSYKML